MKVAINVLVATVLFAATLAAAGRYKEQPYGNCTGQANATRNVIANSFPTVVAERFLEYRVNVCINFCRKYFIEASNFTKNAIIIFFFPMIKKLIFKLRIRSYRVHTSFVASSMWTTNLIHPNSMWLKVASVHDLPRFTWNHNVAMESTQLFFSIHFNVYILNS